MTSSTVTEARKLAADDVGPEPWARQLAKAVAAASDEDLGIMVVARAVLTRAAQERAAEVARLSAAEAERLKQAAKAAADRKLSGLKWRRRTRARNLRGQLLVRLLLSLIYAAFVAFMMREMVGTDLVGLGGPLLGLCAATVVPAVIVDWFAYSQGSELPSRDPAGTARRFSVLAGVLVGLAPWLRMSSAGSDSNTAAVVFRDEPLVIGPVYVQWAFAHLPIAISTAWIIGSVIQIAVGTAAAGRVSARIGRAQKWLWPLSWLGPVAAVSALAIYNIPQLASWTLRTIGSPQVVPQWNPGNLWDNLTALIIIGVTAIIVQYSARRLAARAAPLGVVACGVGALIGLATVFFNPANIVTWLIDYAIRAVL